MHLHLSGGILRPAHPVAFLNHPIKCRSHLHPRVRAVTCNNNFTSFLKEKILICTVLLASQSIPLCVRALSYVAACEH